MEELPKYQDLVLPVLQALAKTKNGLSIQEIEIQVISLLAIPKEISEVLHSGKRTELQYRLAWARTKAKASGWITSPKRETWRITDTGISRLSNN